MAVFTEEAVRANLRVRDGKRVFYLADGDRLTPSARDWIWQEHVEILPAELAQSTHFRMLNGAVLEEKPEHMTHLLADVLVPKNHPRIVFRGMVDLLEAEILLAGQYALEHGRKQTAGELEEILSYVRNLIRCDLLDERLPEDGKLCGLTQQQLREQSHLPHKYLGQPHFMPSFSDDGMLLHLNRIRALIRKTELAVYEAFCDRDGNPTRPDLMRGMNRLSSLLWIMMVKIKKEDRHESGF